MMIVNLGERLICIDHVMCWLYIVLCKEILEFNLCKGEIMSMK